MGTQPIKISTGSYRKEGKVEVDGNIWTIKLPGAGTEMQLSQAQRRLTMLDQKIESGKATEADLDQYDKYEATVYNSFKNMFQDGTKENKQVATWINETPLAIIVQVFEDIKEAANGEKNETEKATD